MWNRAFDIVMIQKVFVESQVENGVLECVSRDSVRVPAEERLPSPYCCCLRFLEYVCDESGTPVGAKMECDGGSGYYGNYGKIVETVYPGQTVEFTHNWTGVDDDGCPEDNSTAVRFRLEKHRETQ